MELVKAVGGLAWAVGVIGLLVAPTFGVLALGVAVVCTILSVQKTRERRHQELLEATRNNPPE